MTIRVTVDVCGVGREESVAMILCFGELAMDRTVLRVAKEERSYD